MASTFNSAQFAEDFRGRRYFASLDGLRTVSILPVVWHHCCDHEYRGLLGRGPIGVDLFFAISGFLITTLLLRERERDGHVELLAFYARRSLRIFPLYYVTLSLHLAFALLVRPNWQPSQNFLVRWPYYATYTVNWFKSAEYSGPALFMFAWSLCIEEQFYAFWAPVLRFCRKLGFAALLMATWLLLDLSIEVGWIGAGQFEDSLVRTIVTSFATPIGIGALLAMAAHHRQLGPWVLWCFGRRDSSVLVAIATLSLVVVPWAPTPVLHLALGLLVLCCALRRDHGMARWLDTAPMRYVGQISYGIYLLHVPVIGAIRSAAPGIRPHALLVFGLALPVTVVLAALSYRYFEEPMMRRAKRFRRT